MDDAMDPTTISHWGAEVSTNRDWLLQEPALSLLNHLIADTFTEIEKWDLLVKKADIRVDSGFIFITAHASQTNDPKDTNYSEHISEEAPRTVEKSFPCCSECSMPIVSGKLHPENGCPYGIIDHVMST